MLGNFGEIPYGKTIVGYAYYLGNKDNSDNRKLCDKDKIELPKNFQQDPDNEFSPLFIVDA
jgi:hypothetical protein